MTNPVTGPFTKTDYLSLPPPYSGYKTWWKQSTSYKQKRPYDLPLPYTVKVGTQVSSYDSTPWDSADVVWLFDHHLSSLYEAQSKAYAKLHAKVSATCEAGVALAEYHQAMNMMTSRVLQVTKFVRALRRLDFHTAASYLVLDSNHGHSDVSRQMRKRWRKDRDLANVFLEVHFGWSPLLEDIHDALEVFSNPITPSKVKVRATGPIITVKTGTSESFTAKTVTTYQSKVQYLTEVVVNNPNLAFIDQFGINNPLAIAWELVPFSFVVDWFVNVGEYLGSLSGAMSYDLVRSATTSLSYLNGVRTWNSYPFVSTMKGFSMSRSSGLPETKLYLRPPKVQSWSRSLTAISLLTQLIPKLPKTPGNRFGLN